MICPLYTPSTTVVTADLMLLHNMHTWWWLVHTYHNFAYTIPWNQNHGCHCDDIRQTKRCISTLMDNYNLFPVYHSDNNMLPIRNSRHSDNPSRSNITLALPPQRALWERPPVLRTQRPSRRLNILSPIVLITRPSRHPDERNKKPPMNWRSGI